MSDVFQIIYEYQLLRTKEDLLQVPLEDDERARLAGLEQLLRGVDRTMPPQGRRQMPRLWLTVPVSFTFQDKVGAGVLTNLSGGGVGFDSELHCPEGAIILLRVGGPSSDVEYVFPVSIMWTNGRWHGAKFEGVPTRSVRWGTSARRRSITPYGLKRVA